MGGSLDFSDRLHEGISDDQLNVGAGVSLRLGSQLAVVGLVEVARRRAHVELEHLEKNRN